MPPLLHRLCSPWQSLATRTGARSVNTQTGVQPQANCLRHTQCVLPGQEVSEQVLPLLRRQRRQAGGREHLPRQLPGLPGAAPRAAAATHGSQEPGRLRRDHHQHGHLQGTRHRAARGAALCTEHPAWSLRRGCMSGARMMSAYARQKGVSSVMTSTLLLMCLASQCVCWQQSHARQIHMPFWRDR